MFEAIVAAVFLLSHGAILVAAVTGIYYAVKRAVHKHPEWDRELTESLAIRDEQRGRAS